MICPFIHKFKKPLPESLIRLRKELKKKSQDSVKKSKLSPHENELIRQIKSRTNQLNKNNVTRTKAYLVFFLRFPEIHWAFLGHMVSRNGGWNMTDLKGALLSRLLTKKEAHAFFTFLERGNWLIFQDAFVQFLIYEESVKSRKAFFHLLPHLGVSIFMETIWNDFWNSKDSYLLTMALIINEQSYLESRVLKNPVFQEKVFNTLEFMLQDLLSMNHILFPFAADGHIKLTGQTLHHFENLHERILLGKRLYAVLFGNKDRLEAVKSWAIQHPHTGSRKDYWPHLFSEIENELPGKRLNPRIRDCMLLPGSSKIYSPKLEFAWKDQHHKPAEAGDWYQSEDVIHYLIKSNHNVDGEIKNDYCRSLERLELAAAAKEAFLFRNEGAAYSHDSRIVDRHLS
jgi:hypothetical protein